MLSFRRIITAGCASLLLSLTATTIAQDKPKEEKPAAPEAASGDKAAAFRRFNTAEGKSFYALITAKQGTAVTFKRQDGKIVTLPIRALSAPDQQYATKWTKFKNDLLNSTEFASLTVQEMLELRGYQSLEFDIEGNHIFVQGAMNDKPVKLMIDTGAHSSIIHDAFAKELGLELGPYDQRIQGVAGSQEAAVTKLTTLQLGDAKINGNRILATNFIPIGGGPGQFDMIFGADFLRELDACISYREGRMFLKPDNLRPSAPANETAKAEIRRWTSSDGAKSFMASLVDKTETDASFELATKQRTSLAIDKLSEADQAIIMKWSKLRDNLTKNPEWRTLTVKELLELREYQSFQYRLDGNHILVDGTIGGPSGEAKARFLIDTGAHSCTMDYNWAKDTAKLEVGKLGETKVRGIGGEADAAFTKVKFIKLGEALIKERTAVSSEIHKRNIGGQGNYDALFGAEFLRELDAVINYKEGRMFLRPDNSDKASEEEKSSEKEQ